MKSLLLVLAVILGCNGQGFQGYFYPRPSIPLQPVCSTSYLTQTLTDTVQVPVYLTSTVVDQQYITVFSTAIQPVTQFQTKTSTLVITPSPVIRYSTLVSTVTVLSGIQDDSQQSVNNGYLPPPQVSDDARKYSSNEYLPPTGGDARSNTGVNVLSAAIDGSAVSGSSERFNPFGYQQISLNLGALPPAY